MILSIFTKWISFGSQSNNQNSTISQTSQGISYIAPDPPKDLGKKKKHYAMEYNSKYKKSDPKEYKVVHKVVDVFYPARILRGRNALNYIIQQVSEPPRVPNMSVKEFFSQKRGRRRGGRK